MVVSLLHVRVCALNTDNRTCMKNSKRPEQIDWLPYMGKWLFLPNAAVLDTFRVPGKKLSHNHVESVSSYHPLCIELIDIERNACVRSCMSMPTNCVTSVREVSLRISLVTRRVLP